MMAAQAQHADLRSLGLGLGVLCVLLVLGAHFFGLMGAAAAPPAALLVRVLYRMRWAQRKFAMPFLRNTARIALPAAAAIAVVFLHPSPTLMVDLAAAFLAYAVLLWATGSLSGADLARLRQFLADNRGLRT
jgi:O-antigen/teichoic acid export membrane protein